MEKSIIRLIFKRGPESARPDPAERGAGNFVAKAVLYGSGTALRFTLASVGVVNLPF